MPPHFFANLTIVSVLGLLYNQIVSKSARFWSVLLVVFSLLAGTGAVVHAQGETSRYFPETGHNVTGEFWQYFQGVPEAGFVFGYPLTEAFTDVKSGRVVQYFTRARFELVPELPEGQRVQLTSLGSKTYVPGSGPNIPAPIGCRYFNSGFSICYAFLDFFDKYGGEAIFGQPISGFEYLDGRIVQYFERARFDWYPEYEEGHKVVLADLGRMFFDLAGENANRLQPVQFDGIVSVLELQTRVFVWKAVTQANDQQAVYVVVQDQTLSPVYNATASIIVYWSKGDPQSVTLSTDRNGVAIATFPVVNQSYGSIVTVKVKVSYPGIEDNAVTSFRVWR
jgi:hypothetical protein